MVTAKIHRPATLELRDKDGAKVARIPLTRPVDDLIALGHLSWEDRRRAALLLRDYGLALHSVPVDPVTPMAKFLMEHTFWVAKETPWPQQIEAAAHKAVSERKLTHSVVESLSRVRFVGDLEVEVSDEFALATWTLLYIAQTGAKYELRPCEHCGVPFLATARARYCRRIAPGVEIGTAVTTCLDIAKARDHRARKKEATRGNDS